MSNSIDERKAEWVTRTVAKNDICPICGKPMSFVCNEEQLAPYRDYLGIAWRDLVANTEAYRGQIELCHLDCLEA